MFTSTFMPRGALTRVCVGACLLTTAMMAPSLWAQDATPGAGEAGTASNAAGSLEEVVVTALKRSTTVQETPLAITALTGETLANAGATSMLDYVKLVPSLRVQDGGPGQRRVSLRGVTAPGEPTVGVYYDETPISGSTGVSSDAAGRSPDLTLFDVERIEVLRGPQGTLYGSSSMGGAIRVIYEKPKFQSEGAAEGTFATTEGGGTSYVANGMINLPLTEHLAARAVLFERDSDGYLDNRFLRISDYNSAETTGGRLLLRYVPTSGLTIDVGAYIESTDAFSSSWQPTVGERTSVAKVRLPYEDDSHIYNITANWQLSGATLTAVSSYFDRESAYAADDSYYIGTFLTPARCASIWNAGAPCSTDRLNNYYSYVNSLIPAAIYYPGTTTNWTNELRLSSSGDNKIDWTVGAFSENRKNHVTSEDVRADAASGQIIEPLQVFYRRFIVDKFEQQAAFGEATYHATPQLALTAGARYYSYDKTVTGETDIPWDLINARITPRTNAISSEDGWNLKLNVAYDVSDEIMLYTTASEGFRPGGANQVIGLPDMLTTYEPDSLWNYEIGAKTSWLGRRLYANAAVYRIDWDNMQVRGRTLDGAFSFLSNAGAARMRGVELELIVQPLAGLSLSANVNYLDAELTEDQISGSITAPGRAGDRIPYIPKVNGAISGEYGWTLTPRLDGFVRLDANYVGSSYSEFRPNNIYRVEIEDYTLVNLRVGIDDTQGDWSAHLYVSNVFDELAINQASASSTPPGSSATSATPRTVGVSLKKRF